ncbi:calcium-binding protein [Bradyrhizobium sp. JYMT SZCCT0428]|uniref:calcium-binding protein n=1 Tax=Bradyrhizobium sp. JYMT SZCCT0428 TaxID=2807673 RepID=UPI001BA6FFF1|nr:calcium-binding protein [Bradyrhizobium sp. JYMT SZCCT0428]MBR1157202.1 hypothetical protein [Bradyrhizobium sp. JYMT SZCCT0428]
MARFVGTSRNDNARGSPTELNTFENFGIGSDTLTGGLKTDLFYLLADPQVDFINGSDGIDRLDYTNSDRALRIDLSPHGSGVTAVLHNLTYTVAQVQNVEDATGSRYDDTIIGTNGINTLDGGGGNDYLYGLGDRDLLLGGAGADRLYGGDQDDTLFGGIGNDYLNGETGLDKVSYADVDRGTNVTVNLSNYSWGSAAPNTAVVHTAIPETDTLVSIENAIGTSYGDNFSGSQQANVFDGSAGDDLLFGHGGDDTLLGGEGGDQLSGGMGADKLIGGNGVDWADYSRNLSEDDPYIYQNPPSTSVVISLINPANNTWWAAGDTYDSIENVYGSLFNDVITGNDDDNIIAGGYGSNTLYGNGGNDTFVGSPLEADTFNGGGGSDTVDYSGAILSGMVMPTVSTNVTIDLQNQGVNAGAAAGDLFIGYTENIIGTSLSDTILGNNLNNDFRGGGGADRLMGRGGTDTLRGDEGIDTAVFRGNVEDYEFRVLHFNTVISDTGYPFERFLEVRDLTGNRDGTDYVIGIEQLEFNGVVHNLSEWII